MNSPKTRRESEIWQACEALYLELGNETGEGITGDKIVSKLLELGFKKGSPNEIYRYRKSWFDMRGLDKDRPHQGSFISDPLNRAVQMVKEEIEKEARAELAEIKAQYDSQLKQLEAVYHSTKAELLQFIEKNDQLTALLKEAQQDNMTLTAKNKDLLEQNALLASQLSLLEKQTQTLQATYSQSLAALKEAAEAQQTERNEKYVALKSAWEKDASSYKELNESQRHKYMMEAENLRGEIRQLTEKLKTAELEKFTAQQQATFLKNQNVEQFRQLQQQILQLTTEVQKHHSDMSEMQQALQGEKISIKEEAVGFLSELKLLLPSLKKTTKKMSVVE